MLCVYHTSPGYRAQSIRNRLKTKHNWPWCEWRSTCYPNLCSMFQTSIQHPVSTEGVGLHTGVFGHVSLLPAPGELLAVMNYYGIDQKFSDIDSIEVPILDCSAEPFLQLLDQAGVRR